jgi:RNA polymerase-associated protein RTF1
MSGKRVSTRNLDAKGNKFKRAAALAKIREVGAHAVAYSLLFKCLINNHVSVNHLTSQNRASKAPTKDESDSDLDYGKDSDDSDDDYEDSTMIKPWQQTARKTTQLERESSEDESFDERRGKEPGRKRAEDIPADLQDFSLVTIPRRRLIRWCNEPFFEDAIKQCYVRLGIGRDSKTQKACYRLCKVIGVESKKEYSFPPELNQMPVSSLHCTF